MKIIYSKIRCTKILKLEGDIEMIDLEVFNSIVHSIFKEDEVIGFDLSRSVISIALF